MELRKRRRDLPTNGFCTHHRTMIRRQWSIVIASVRMLLVLLLIITLTIVMMMMMDMVLKIHNDSGIVYIIIGRQQLKVCIIDRTVRTDGIHL